MKQIKNIFWGFLVVFMLIGFMNIESMAINVDSDESSFKNIETKEMELDLKEVNNMNALTEDESETESSETNNWELNLVFYDSTVDDGTTPLTEINWNASDGGYKTGKTRVITVQINYKNTNAITTYQPGDLKISIPNLVYNTGNNTDKSPYWESSVKVGANDSTHIGYDWDFATGNRPDNTQETYQFQNANIIEAKSNFEGSIQIVYTITREQLGNELPSIRKLAEASSTLGASMTPLLLNTATFY